MKTESFKMIKLTASTGMVLTNGNIKTHTVFLGVNDSADNWHEIPDSEVPKEEPSDIPEKIGDGEHGN